MSPKAYGKKMEEKREECELEGTRKKFKSDDNKECSITESVETEVPTIKNFEDFTLLRVLNESSERKTICVLGGFNGKEAPAIVLLEKEAFSEDSLKGILGSDSSLLRKFQNDIYGRYDCHSNPVFNNINATIIYPATEKHVQKYQTQPSYLIEETVDLYKTVTLPYLEKGQFSTQWVDNILEHKSESDRIVFEDPDPEVGFILLPDLKWDVKQIENLYLVAITHKKGIKSLRDLNADHLPLLRNIKEKGAKAIQEKYKLSRNKLRIYVHYQPSYYHLHVHFTNLNYNAPGIFTEKSHMLSTVIENIDLVPDYYQKVTLPFVVRQNEELFKRYESVLYKKKLPGTVNNLLINIKKMAVASVIAEMRPRLRVCNVFVKVPEHIDEENGIQIKVESSSVSIKGISKKDVLKVLFNGCKLVPDTVSGLQIKDQFCSFRVQVEPLNKTTGSCTAEILTLNRLVLSSCKSQDKVIVPALCVGEQYKIFCGSCHSVLSQDCVVFKRVLPLPSESWEDRASDWFCHRHKSHDELLKLSTLAPKEQDCFYGLKFWVLNSCIIPNVNIDSHVAVCKKCMCWLGTVKNSSVKLWNSTVLWKHSDLECNPTVAPLHDFLDIIKSTVQETEVMCRLCVVVPVSSSENHYLLLWVMDNNIELLCYIDGQATYKMAEATTKKSVGEMNVSLESKDINAVSEITLQPKYASKVLYKYQTACSEDVKAWLKDINVQRIQMAKNMVEEGLKHLTEAATYIPLTCRMTDGFSVSYLGL